MISMFKLKESKVQSSKFKVQTQWAGYTIGPALNFEF